MRASTILLAQYVGSERRITDLLASPNESARKIRDLLNWFAGLSWLEYKSLVIVEPPLFESSRHSLFNADSACENKDCKVLKGPMLFVLD